MATSSLMDTQDLEREYSPSSCIGGDYRPFIDAYRTESHTARQRSVALGAVWSSPRYGLGAAQRMDLCVPASQAASGRPLPGLLVFIHGGYWQELSAQESLFAAANCVERGLAFAAIDYTLAPQASVADIVAECRLAMRFLFRNAQSLGFDGRRIVVAGSSAGAHLAAMVAWPGWRVTGAGEAFEPQAVVLVSGVFDLEPLVATSINAAVGLDVCSAREQSPARLALAGFPRTVVCWGEVETREFKRQSRDFADALLAGGVCCEAFEVPGRNHFDIVFDLTDSSSQLGHRTWSLFAD